MCGHAQISAPLVQRVLADVRGGILDVREAAITLAKPCVCGFFNTHRAEKLLRTMV